MARTDVLNSVLIEGTRVTNSFTRTRTDIIDEIFEVQVEDGHVVLTEKRRYSDGYASEKVRIALTPDAAKHIAAAMLAAARDLPAAPPVPSYP